MISPAQRMAISERLAKIRGNRSQREWARQLGVFQQNVNRYENGTVPGAAFLISLLTKERVNLNWLLTGKGSPRLRAS